MDAIIADIHGNLEALNTVLDAIRETPSSRIICLGDVVGYGPDSVECVRRSAKWDVVILGDFDATLIDHKIHEWNPVLNRHIDQMRDEFIQSPDKDLLYATVSAYKNSHVESGIHFAHGSPHDRREWVFPEDTCNSRKLNRLADQFDTALVCGHSHINGVFRRQPDRTWVFVQPVDGRHYDISIADKTIVTIGSVGQPRDNDPRAAYAIRDGSQVTFHRVAYDFEVTMNKIRKNPDIDDMYADRLKSGV